MSQKLTIFQKLTKSFTKDGFSDPSLSRRYVMASNDTLTSTNKAEHDVKVLQAKQNKFLSNLWQKVDNELYQKTIQYETNRLAAYADFEVMESYPEISAALDIFMEESTTPNDKGRILNIHSKSERIQGILEDLFFNRLDIHVSLPMWVRNTIKYGDNFVFLKVDSRNGVMAGKQLPNFEIERKEGELYNTINNGSRDKVTFNWRGRNIDFQSWQIAHFRLLGDDRRLPYGTSMLEKVRRIHKQLILAEDAMLVYRITRAPERRVFKIYVGNLDEEDVGPYVNEIINRYKRSPVVDPRTGQVDLNYNQLANDQDYFIPIRDVNEPTPIETLQGASNLNDIEDIMYLQRKLFTGIRIPKAFLNYDEAQGDGKNLALLDIRFSRTVNRIQQAIIQELNKIAIIHLYSLGFIDDLDNFSITMNNPSSQAEMLRIQNMQTKATLARDLATDIGNGFSLMSLDRARKEVFGWSDRDNKKDMLEQRMLKAASIELENTGSVIKNTGIFDSVDKLYGDISAARAGGDGGDSESDGSGGGSFGGGGGGGMSMDGGDLDSGDDLESEDSDEQGMDFGLEGETFPEEDGNNTSDDSGDVELKERNNNRDVILEAIVRNEEIYSMLKSIKT